MCVFSAPGSSQTLITESCNIFYGSEIPMHDFCYLLQHHCVWDAPSSQCKSDVPCEERAAHRCTFELTTGTPQHLLQPQLMCSTSLPGTGKVAPWDQTQNRCFWEVPLASPLARARFSRDSPHLFRTD